MQDKQSAAILGYSGHSFVVLEAAIKAGIDVKYYCEKRQAEINPFNIDYLGNEAGDIFDWNVVNNYILGIGDNTIRRKVANLIISKSKTLLNVIHPSSVISASAKVGSGNFIAANVTVNALAQIADFCIINTGSIIEHECVVRSGAHIAPGSVLAGNVTVGENSFLGANSVVRQGVQIGAGVTVGAGSVVLKDIPDNEIWVGNPAKQINR